MGRQPVSRMNERTALARGFSFPKAVAISSSGRSFGWRTGTTEEDGSKELLVDSQGEEFLTLYQLINIDHRQEYTWGQGGDLFGRPREIRFGLQLEF